ncbi:MAG: ribonucleoside-diphosphate reductase [Stutzerimonas stutzeri]|nr:MAG: ribonucleoside-diphosphate reductase [Stutzerimonas stutzeri]
MSRFRIVTADGCSFCTRAKALLAVNNLSFTEEHLTTPEQRQAFKAEGFKTVPQIWDGDVHVGGFDQLKRYLER